jgi:hypothetical protein
MSLVNYHIALDAWKRPAAIARRFVLTACRHALISIGCRQPRSRSWTPCVLSRTPGLALR